MLLSSAQYYVEDVISSSSTTAQPDTRSALSRTVPHTLSSLACNNEMIVKQITVDIIVQWRIDLKQEVTLYNSKKDRTKLVIPSKYNNFICQNQYVNNATHWYALHIVYVEFKVKEKRKDNT